MILLLSLPPPSSSACASQPAVALTPRERHLASTPRCHPYRVTTAHAAACSIRLRSSVSLFPDQLTSPFSPVFALEASTTLLPALQPFAVCRHHSLRTQSHDVSAPRIYAHILTRAHVAAHSRLSAPLPLHALHSSLARPAITNVHCSETRIDRRPALPSLCIYRSWSFNEHSLPSINAPVCKYMQERTP
ncbi:hypothetical protein FB45DRAFT_419488 [Roridomyces roridus]|uniref:Uncharacterized protein n=1 Tax=Roridomyces roridus TaxID=1738132 RepID=A0AAD7C6V9_9AGAR|nr:hypothetical protein FB45DRAFT_419488 [Roridomyces roridus]